jgi:hypothetical protein
VNIEIEYSLCFLLFFQIPHLTLLMLEFVFCFRLYRRHSDEILWGLLVSHDFPVKGEKLGAVGLVASVERAD